MKSNLRTVPKRREREGKTDYDKRIRLLKSGENRLVIRPSLKNITVQIINYNPEGDNVEFGEHSTNLEKYGWKVNKGNIPAAYLTGYILGKKASSDIDKAILDSGLKKPEKGSRIYACVKGVIDGGINIPIKEKMIPDEGRIKGKHIAEHAEANPDQFSQYKKQDINPKEITELFEKVKTKIEEET